MLSRQDLETFHELGFVRVRGAFAPDEARAMEKRVWGGLREKYGMRENQPETWRVVQPTGLQPLRKKPVFGPIGSPKTIEAIDDVLGEDRWKRPAHWGQFLVTFPDRTRGWAIPRSGWHTDFGYLDLYDGLMGLLVLSFLSDVPARSGGTLAVAASHRVVRRYVKAHPEAARERMKTVRQTLLRRHAWLNALTAEGSEDGDATSEAKRCERFMGESGLVEGLPLRVVELTADAGDLFLVHPWTLHAAALNCGERPRIMCAQRVQLR